jgi:hypothetical protein
MIVTRPCDWLPAPAERSPEAVPVDQRKSRSTAPKMPRRPRGSPPTAAWSAAEYAADVGQRSANAGDARIPMPAKPPAATSSSHRKSIASCARWPSRPTRSVSWWSWSCARAGRLPFDKDWAACSALVAPHDHGEERRLLLPATRDGHPEHGPGDPTLDGGRAAPGGQRRLLDRAAQERRRPTHLTLPAVVVEALAEHLRHYTAESPEASVF